MPRGNVCKYGLCWSNYWFDKYEWKLFDPGINSATQKMWMKGKHLILGILMGVSGLSAWYPLYHTRIYTHSKTFINFIHFQNRHGVDWNLDGFGNVSRLVSLNIIFICDQNVFTLNIYISIILGLNRNMFRCTGILTWFAAYCYFTYFCIFVCMSIWLQQ